MNASVEWVWGVDIAISKQAFGFAPLDGAAIEVETLHTGNEAREGQRFGWLDRQLRIYAGQVAPRYPPACVWVEQPSGASRNLQLTYACGVIQAALFEALACPVWTIPSGTWKKRTVGVGNATKAQVAAWVADRADVSSQDEADAYAIAAAGRAMFSAGQWDAVAA
jgi:Holliday junction resolvasome RuvABC endonuclease subunit